MGVMVLGLWLAVMMGSPTPGPTVEIAPFSGGLPAQELRARIHDEIEGDGFEVVELRASSLPDPSYSHPTDLEWLYGGSEARFLVMGRVLGPEGDQRIEVSVYQRGHGLLQRFTARRGEGDLILPLILPDAVAGSIADRVAPPPPPTEEELEVLAHLDEPDSTPEALPREGPYGCILRMPEPCPGCFASTGRSEVDLRRDFGEFCRVGPRRGRDDFRPVCKRGPVLGYVHRRTWMTGAATLLAGGATGLAFGLRATGWSHGGVRWAGHEVSAPLTAWGATSAAVTGTLLGATIGLLISDRRRARRSLRQERELRSLR